MSGAIFRIAKQAYERAKTPAKPDRFLDDSYEPLIAIVFAAAAGEAFINEIGELASHPRMGPEPDCVPNLASLLSEVEDARGNTTLKYLLAKLALAGNAYDKGVNPYQDFAVLMELRNSLLHLKFDRIESVKINETRIQHPPVVGKLRSRNILAQFENVNTLASWVLHISTPAVARWACNATAAIVGDLVQSIPDSDLRRAANLFYVESSAFAPVS